MDTSNVAHESDLRETELQQDDDMGIDLDGLSSDTTLAASLTAGATEIKGFEVDTHVITPEEALQYIEAFHDRHHPRRIQAWFDHCARIRRDPKAVSPDQSCDPRVR